MKDQEHLKKVTKVTTIGRAEFIDLPGQNISHVPARVDTGAKTSSIWATNINLGDDGILRCTLFGPSSEHFRNEVITFTDFEETVVASSIGAIQKRFKVIIPVILKGRRIKANFTLADRSTQVYPILIGRNTLMGKFVVDVKAGTVLNDKEKARTYELRKLIE